MRAFGTFGADEVAAVVGSAEVLTQGPVAALFAAGECLANVSRVSGQSAWLKTTAGPSNVLAVGPARFICLFSSAGATSAASFEKYRTF